MPRVPYDLTIWYLILGSQHPAGGSYRNASGKRILHVIPYRLSIEAIQVEYPLESGYSERSGYRSGDACSIKLVTILVASAEHGIRIKSHLQQQIHQSFQWK